MKRSEKIRIGVSLLILAVSVTIVIVPLYLVVLNSFKPYSEISKNISALLISIMIPLAVGSISALISGNTMAYQTLIRPPLSPPAFLFPVVWTILYLLMGISSYMIYVSGDPNTGKALKYYALQLLFNFGWSILFFGLSQYLLSFIWLIALILLIAVTIYQFYRISPLAACLQIPYLLWCLFAAYLNLSIYLLNR